MNAFECLEKIMRETTDKEAGDLAHISWSSLGALVDKSWNLLDILDRTHIEAMESDDSLGEAWVDLQEEMRLNFPRREYR